MQQQFIKPRAALDGSTRLSALDSILVFCSPSIVLAYPETLIAVIALEVALGKWRGLRLLEYARFADLAREKPAA